MPLGNLTSQFFANIYLNELDYFVKHELKAKYYIRYVDDFVLLHNSKEQLEKWKSEINDFLNNELRIELHPDKSKIISLSKGIDSARSLASSNSNVSFSDWERWPISFLTRSSCDSDIDDTDLTELTV
jgi:hypothetical protein